MGLSCDSNILFYALNAESPEHAAASRFLQAAQGHKDFLLCELVLVELYVLIRNPALVPRPASPDQAVSTIRQLSRGPFRVVDYPGGLMPEVWWHSAQPNTARRRIYDIRLAVTLRE